MLELIKLTRHELKLQNKVHNLAKYIFIFLFFCSITGALINSEENITKFATIFSVIALPLAFMGITSNVLKSDIEDGNLELLLQITTPSKIIITKYLALALSGLFGFLLNIPLIYFIYNIEVKILTLIFICGILLILTSSALISLIAAIQGYFRSNTNFLAILIMPLIIPNIVLTGIILQNNAMESLLLVMLGINMVIVPVTIFLSSYLIKNIYS
ncbi:MAG: heme exporter protein CcmB [Rickettsiaceae bacterium]|nr:heme exporter protein CcmB [Rickettsiaceae bacterium]